MPLSTSGGVAGDQVPFPSAPNGSQPSMPNSKSYLDLQREMDLAEQARLMRDNDNQLSLSLASNKADREQQLQFRADQMRQAAKEVAPLSTNNSPVSLPEPEMGDINVSSPKTENHYHLPAQASPAVAPVAPATPASGLSGLAKAGLGAALAAGLLGAGAGGYFLNKPQPSNTTTNVTKGIGSTIDLVSPKGP